MSTGKPLPHDSARLHVTGAAHYVDDTAVPETCLHLVFGLSECAHGTITALDLSFVRASPGVISVMTAADLPHANDVSPSPEHEPMLAEGEVLYHGQPVFLVAATTHRAARAAARRARMTIEEKQAVITIDQALEAESYLEGGRLTWSRGDVEAAMPAADLTVEGEIEIGGQEHFYLEGQAAFAQMEDDGGVTVRSSTQHPSEIQHKVAHALGLPNHAVRVETRRMGGGFGGKESQGNSLAVACSVMAHATGRPCKMRYDRDDDMVITGKRHDMRLRYRAGVDKRGRLMAVDFEHFVRCGWSADLSHPVADRAMLHADNAYFIPNMRIESHRLRTNTASATAFRGFGGPQGMLGIERVMDHLAHKLKMDPSELRRRNFYNKTKPQDTHYGQPVKGFVLPDMWRTIEENAKVSERRAMVEKWNAANETLKRGLAVTPVKFGISFTLTHLNQAGALVHIYPDGSVQINHGGTEMGQGLYQKVRQVAAIAFGLDPAAIRVTATDTSKVPNTSATAASSGADLNGAAVLAACEELKRRIARFLTEGTPQKPKQLAFKDGNVKFGSTRMSFGEAAQKAYEARISLSATGFYKTPDLDWDRETGTGQPFFYFANGVAVTEVILDTLTGENRILRTDILHDVGESLNPALDLGQIEGGFVQGSGWLTSEELVWDDKGRLRTHAPSTYKIPTAADAPEVFNVALWGQKNTVPTVGRSKAVGEPPFMLGISTFLALSDAAAACGSNYPELNAPATPEEVLGAIKRAGANEL